MPVEDKNAIDRHSRLRGNDGFFGFFLYEK